MELTLHRVTSRQWEKMGTDNGSVLVVEFADRPPLRIAFFYERQPKSEAEIEDSAA